MFTYLERGLNLQLSAACKVYSLVMINWDGDSAANRLIYLFARFTSLCHMTDPSTIWLDLICSKTFFPKGRRKSVCCVRFNKYKQSKLNWSADGNINQIGPAGLFYCVLLTKWKERLGGERHLLPYICYWQSVLLMRRL